MQILAFLLTTWRPDETRYVFFAKLPLCMLLLCGHNATDGAKQRLKPVFHLATTCSRDAKRKQESGTVMVKIGWRKNSPRTCRTCSYFFVCSREQVRQVENRLKSDVETVHLPLFAITRHCDLRHRVITYDTSGLPARLQRALSTMAEV